MTTNRPDNHFPAGETGQESLTAMETMVESHIDLVRGKKAMLAIRIDEVEKKYDQQCSMVFQAFKKLEKNSAPPPKRHIGFRIQ